MFNFWPFNVARKRRERQEAQRQIEQLAISAGEAMTFKRNKVIPMDDPRHPRNLTPEQRRRIKEREAERQAAIQRDRDAWARHERQSRQRTETSAPAADDLYTIGSPLSVWHPAHPIYHSSPAPESRCDSPSDSSSYDSGSSSCDSSSSSD